MKRGMRVALVCGSSVAHRIAYLLRCDGPRRSAADAVALTSDFRTTPDQSNPNPDSYGHLDVWSFMEGRVLHRPSSYRLLDTFIPDAFAVNGLEQWQGDISGGPWIASPPWASMPPASCSRSSRFAGRRTWFGSSARGRRRHRRLAQSIVPGNMCVNAASRISIQMAHMTESAGSSTKGKRHSARACSRRVGATPSRLRRALPQGSDVLLHRHRRRPRGTTGNDSSGCP